MTVWFMTVLVTSTGPLFCCCIFEVFATIFQHVGCCLSHVRHCHYGFSGQPGRS